MGRLILDEDRQFNGVKCILPFNSFIATRLLPCSEIDRPIQKFTGNDSLGEAKDDMTMAIHAYTHFTSIVTRSTVVVTDLQGTRMHLEAWSKSDDQNQEWPTRMVKCVSLIHNLTRESRLVVRHKEYLFCAMKCEQDARLNLLESWQEDDYQIGG